jgi:hypothetical protein
MYASNAGGSGGVRRSPYGYTSNDLMGPRYNSPVQTQPSPGGGGGNVDISDLLGSIMRWPFNEGTLDPLFNGQAFGSGTPAPATPPGTNSGILNGLLSGMDLKIPGVGRAAAIAPPEPTQPEMNPDQQALAQLYELVTGGGTGGPSEEELNASLNESAAGINQQYGAQIGALRHANQGARQDTKKNSAEVQAMYDALAGSYNRAGKREMRQGNRLSNRLQNMGEQAQNATTTQAERLNESSAAAAQGLGLADLGQELVQQNNQTAQRQSKVAGQRGQMAANTVLGQAGNNRTFMNTSGMASELEGTNQAADMYGQLQDYLQQNRSQMASLAGERAAAQAAAKAEITGQYASAQGDQQQQMIENLMGLYGLGHQAQGDQFDQNLALQELAQKQSGAGSDMYDLLPDQMGGPAKLLAQFGRPRVNELFNQVSGSNEMATGYFNPGSQPSQQQPLQGNKAAIMQYLQQAFGDEYNQLPPAAQSTLVAALMMQLQGSSSIKATP